MTRQSIELGNVTVHNLKQVKVLNTVVFPVSYNHKFYIDMLKAGELAKLAYYNDLVVGAVCCRIDNSDNRRRLYIMTLGCLSKYRRMGIGTHMLNHILNYVAKKGDFESIYLHVQVNNDIAIDFYKKFGFEIVETCEHYYKRIKPADAYVLKKTMAGGYTNGNAMANASTNAAATATTATPITTTTTNCNINNNVNNHGNLNGATTDLEKSMAVGAGAAAPTTAGTVAPQLVTTTTTNNASRGSTK